MLKRFIIPLLASAATLMACNASIASADEVNQLEHEQVGNSPAPDVDPNASQGEDSSIVQQQDQQIDDSAKPDVDPNASQGPDDSIVKQEDGQIPH